MLRKSWKRQLRPVDIAAALIGKEKFSVDVRGVKLGGVSPTEAVIGVTPVLQFSQAVTQSVYVERHVPNDWYPGTDINCHVHWAPVSGAAGDVVWILKYTSLASHNNEVLTAATTDLSVIDSTQSLQDEILESEPLIFSGVNLALQDILSLQFLRDTSDELDTYGAGASLIRLDFEYTSKGRGLPV